MKRLVVLIFIMLVAAGSAAAYVRITLSNGQSPKCLIMPLTYFVNGRGSSQIGNGSEFLAVRGAFQTWQDVASANVILNYGGTSPVSTIGRDGINLISFSDDTTPLGATTLAATFSFFGVTG